MNTHFKILWTTFLMCCLSLGMQAQKYEVGQHVTVDGHSAIVVYVDSTGEHGLFAGPALLLYDKKKYSPEKYVTKKFSGDKKKRDALRFFQQGKLGVVLEAQLTKDEVNDLYRPALDGLTSILGDENQRAVINYCQQKGLDVAKIFPEFAWAQSLGEGWFLGGMKEILAYVNNIAKSRENTLELNQKSIDEGHTYFYPLDVISTTHKEYMGRMCYLAQCWTYQFRFKKVQEYQYVVAAKKTMPVWVEKKELVREFYHEWTLGASFFGNFLQSSRELSNYYDPHYNWKKYSYRLAFKRF